MGRGKQCEICTMFFKNKRRMLSIFECEEHLFCDLCCNKIFEAACESLKKQLVCPTCSSNFDTQSVFFKSKPSSQRERFFRQRLKSRTIKCPTPECASFLHLSATNPAKCHQCSASFCHVCIAPFHKLSECPEYTQKLKLMETFDYKTCNKCLMVLEKSEGCQHMKCICGHEFCYTCGQPWAAYHVCAHLRHKVEDSMGALRVRPENQRRNFSRNRRVEAQKRRGRIRGSFFTCLKLFVFFVIIFKLVTYTLNRQGEQNPLQEVDQTSALNCSMNCSTLTQNRSSEAAAEEVPGGIGEAYVTQ